MRGDQLTRSQAARRERVIRAAIDLAASGGYDAVQMRDVAAHGQVALGTIYRYFTSKDHLLAAAQVEWVTDLERRVGQRPPRQRHHRRAHGRHPAPGHPGHGARARRSPPPS